eukprot:gene8827-18274_t
MSDKIVIKELVDALRENFKQWRVNHLSDAFADICSAYLNRNGSLDVKGFTVLLNDQRFDYDNDKNNLKALFSAIDINGNGDVSPLELEDFIYPPRSEADIIAAFSNTYYQALARNININDIFSRLDKDGNGFVGLSELGENAPLIGISLTNSECETAMNLIDIDEDGCISLDDFNTFIKIKVLHESNINQNSSNKNKNQNYKSDNENNNSEELSPNSKMFHSNYNDIAKQFRIKILKHSNGIKNAKSKLKKAFQQLDRDNDGKATVDELRLLIETVCEIQKDPSSDRLINLLIEQIDLNRDGVITYSELEMFLWPHGSRGNNSVDTNTATAAATNRELGLVLLQTRQ